MMALEPNLNPTYESVAAIDKQVYNSRLSSVTCMIGQANQEFHDDDQI